MRIWDATWECDNLGLSAVEIEFETGEQGFDPSERERIEQADYALARVPVGQTELIHWLEERGFRFLATQCSMTIELSDQTQPPTVAKTICRQIDAREINTSEELERIIIRMDADMFDTDRISMDPALPNRHALKRHDDIIRSLFADDRNVCQGLYLRDELIGFFQLQYRSDEHFFASLAGVFSSYKGSGLGVAAIWTPIHWAVQNQLRRLTTSNSVNNPDSVRMHLAMGYRIERFHYVLRRMNSNHEA